MKKNVHPHDDDELGWAKYLPEGAPCTPTDDPEDEKQCGQTANLDDPKEYDLIL